MKSKKIIYGIITIIIIIGVIAINILIPAPNPTNNDTTEEDNTTQEEEKTKGTLYKYNIEDFDYSNISTQIYSITVTTVGGGTGKALINLYPEDNSCFYQISISDERGSNVSNSTNCSYSIEGNILTITTDFQNIYNPSTYYSSMGYTSNISYEYNHITTAEILENWKGIIMQAIEGPYHFWYIYMMIGVYLLIPFLRRITENKTLMEVFIILFLVFEFLTNYGPVLPVIGTTIDEVLGYASFHFTLGYTGYFVAGYYFHKFSVSKRLEIILYIFGIIFLFGAGGLCFFTSINDSIGFNITSYLLPNVAIESFAIYTFFVKRVSKWNFKPFVKYTIEKISDYSSGIYYIHALSLALIDWLGLSPTILSPFIMVPTMTFLAVIISMIVVWFIRKIPGWGMKIT